MSSLPRKQTEKRSNFSIERKLQFTLLVTTIFPLIMLAAALVTGMYRMEAILGAIGCQVIGLGLGFSFCSEMVRQSKSISETLAKINRGDFEARTQTISADELGDAAAAINTMCDNTLNLIQSHDERDQIQTSIEDLISEMKGIAAGDLTIKTAVNDDMTGSIAESVNHMTQQLRSIVERVKSAAEQVTNSSTRIRESSTLMSHQSDFQANRIGEASQQLLEMTDSFQNVAELTKESMQVAVEARQTASNGLKAVSDTVDGMQRIRTQVQNTSKRIKRFGESSQEIGEIVQLISDIADQTSILALNASIQASMAGEAGHGFAVVAEEIESLAERSTDATKQISKLIRGIQHETSEVISDMEESTREVVAGSQLAAQAGETLSEIDTVSSNLVELIQITSTSALEQADRATKVADTMSEISESTKETAEKSREATQSIGRLAAMVNQLRGSVSQFKVSDQAEMADDLVMTPKFDAAAEHPPVAEKQNRKAVHTMMMADLDSENLAEHERLPERTIDEDLLRQLQEASKLLDENPNSDTPSKPVRDSKNTSASEPGTPRRVVPRTMTMDDE